MDTGRGQRGGKTARPVFRVREVNQHKKKTKKGRSKGVLGGGGGGASAQGKASSQTDNRANPAMFLASSPKSGMLKVDSDVKKEKAGGGGGGERSLA